MAKVPEGNEARDDEVVFISALCWNSFYNSILIFRGQGVCAPSALFCSCYLEYLFMILIRFPAENRERRVLWPSDARQEDIFTSLLARHLNSQNYILAHLLGALGQHSFLNLLSEGASKTTVLLVIGLFVFLKPLTESLSWLQYSVFLTPINLCALFPSAPLFSMEHYITSDLSRVITGGDNQLQRCFNGPRCSVRSREKDIKLLKLHPRAQPGSGE